MKKSVLIIRPKDQAAEVANYLKNSGFEVFIEPTFVVQKSIEPDADSLAKIFQKKIAAIILTSANADKTALQVISDLNLDKNIKIFAVGKKTAKTFVDLGYKNILFSEEKSAESLERKILSDKEIISQKSEEVLLYFCGEIITLDFQARLAELNVKLEKIISYKILEKEKFSEEFLTISKKSNFDFTLIYSKNSLKHFFELLKKHNLFESFQGRQILCLSAKILSLARDLGFKNSATFAEISILKKFYD